MRIDKSMVIKGNINMQINSTMHDECKKKEIHSVLKGQKILALPSHFSGKDIVLSS